MLYANRALRPQELYFAILTATDSLSTASIVWDHGVVDDTAIKNFILSSSKGLIEVVHGHGSRQSSVQFIHDSVREYLTTSGILQLAASLSENIIGNSHLYLARWCRSYLDLSFKSGVRGQLKYAIVRETIGTTSQAFSDPSLLTSLPFLPYAIDGILQHSETAACCGTVVQIPLEDTIRLRLWLGLRGILKQFKCPPGLLHIFAHERCTSLICQELKRCPPHRLHSYINEPFPNDHPVGDVHGTALQTAIARHYCDVAEILLQNGAKINVSFAGAVQPLHFVLSRYSWVT